MKNKDSSQADRGLPTTQPAAPAKHAEIAPRAKDEVEHAKEQVRLETERMLREGELPW